jgi:hypothetical protein
MQHTAGSKHAALPGRLPLHSILTRLFCSSRCSLHSSCTGRSPSQLLLQGLHHAASHLLGFWQQLQCTVTTRTREQWRAPRVSTWAQVQLLLVQICPEPSSTAFPCTAGSWVSQLGQQLAAVATAAVLVCGPAAAFGPVSVKLEEINVSKVECGGEERWSTQPHSIIVQKQACTGPQPAAGFMSSCRIASPANLLQTHAQSLGCMCQAAFAMDAAAAALRSTYSSTQKHRRAQQQQGLHTMQFPHPYCPARCVPNPSPTSWCVHCGRRHLLWAEPGSCLPRCKRPGSQPLRQAAIQCRRVWARV